MTLLKLSVASERLGVSPQTVRNWIKQHKIKGTIIEGKTAKGQTYYNYFVDHREVEQYVNPDQVYYESKEEATHNNLISLINGVQQHVNGLSLSIREMSTNAAIQLNESKRRGTENQLNKIIVSQQEIYIKLKECFQEIASLKAIVSKMQHSFPGTEKDIGCISNVSTKDTDCISNVSTKDTDCISRTLKKVPDDPYDKWGGR